MAKFYVDWDNVEPNEMPSLVEAVARYASMNKFACLADVFAILGIIFGSAFVLYGTFCVFVIIGALGVYGNLLSNYLSLF